MKKFFDAWRKARQILREDKQIDAWKKLFRDMPLTPAVLDIIASKYGQYYEVISMKTGETIRFYQEKPEHAKNEQYW